MMKKGLALWHHNDLHDLMERICYYVKDDRHRSESISESIGKTKVLSCASKTQGF